MHGNYKHRAMPTGHNSELDMGPKTRREWKRKWKRAVRTAEKRAIDRVIRGVDDPDDIRDDPPRYMYET